jgi:murein DD-endopeptidase MepM/ murein hydrolase activator NlpD
VTIRGILGVVLTAAVVGCAVLAWFRAEGDAPIVDGSAPDAIGAAGRTISIDVSDSGSGLRQIRVVIEYAMGEAVVMESLYPGNLGTGGSPPRISERVEFHIDPAELDLPEGTATLVATARDWSWRNGFLGNETIWQVPLKIDLTKPRIGVDSGLTYISRGGSGAVVYRLGESTVRDGVQVGDAFYRGYPFPGDQPGDERGEKGGSSSRFALFAVATDAPTEPRIEVIAQDSAGNIGRAGWPVVLKEKKLPEDDVILPRSFMETTVRNLAGVEGIATDDLDSAFDEINTRVRASNEARIREITRNSANTQLWKGAFTQLKNSQVTSRFAERRSYFSDGKKISNATHFGYDLASTSGAPIEASNAGRVAFAGDLGIYGQCVIVDHGLGLFTLYAHLSRMDVKAGDDVEQNGQLGLSGATGLAGGDHLHFATIVGGTYVEPLEWWDPLWVRTHIEARISP